MKRVEFIGLIAFVLISLFCVAGWTFASDIRNYNPDYSTRPNTEYVIRPAQLEYSIPDGWQADWRGQMLWLTHTNADGTVADSLSFIGVEGLYEWIESHPDFCDVSVEDYMKQINNEQ